MITELFQTDCLSYSLSYISNLFELCSTETGHLQPSILLFQSSVPWCFPSQEMSEPESKYNYQLELNGNFIKINNVLWYWSLDFY